MELPTGMSKRCVSLPRELCLEAIVSCMASLRVQ